MSRHEERMDEARSTSKWHEQCIECLLSQSGLEVVPEPSINGKTPDLMIVQYGQPDVIIECMVRMKDSAHEKELLEHGLHVCGGDLSKLYCNLYSRVEEKTTKYRQIVEDRPYVVAVYDESCLNFLDTAYALAFSAHVPYVTFNTNGNIIDRGYEDAWEPEDQSIGLFQRYPHLSGIIYSHWEKKHYFLPNPFAVVPVSDELFPFASVPKAPIIDGEPAWVERKSLMIDNYTSPPYICRHQVEQLEHMLVAV